MYKNYNPVAWHMLRGLTEHNKDVCTLEASVVTGLESMAFDECQEKLRCRTISDRGRIIFDLPVEQVPEALKLCSVDHVSVILGKFDKMKFSKDKSECLNKIIGLVDLPDWEKGLRAWKTVSGFTANIPIPAAKNMHEDNTFQTKESETGTDEGGGDLQIAISEETAVGHVEDTYEVTGTPQEHLIGNTETAKVVLVLPEMQDNISCIEENMRESNQGADERISGNVAQPGVMEGDLSNEQSEGFVTEKAGSVTITPNNQPSDIVTAEEAITKQLYLDTANQSIGEGDLGAQQSDAVIANSKQSSNKEQLEAHSAEQTLPANRGIIANTTKDRGTPTSVEDRVNSACLKVDPSVNGTPCSVKEVDHSVPKSVPCGDGAELSIVREAESCVPKFRVTCYRSCKSLCFTSMDGAREFGGAVYEKFGWKVDMTKFDIEVIITVETDLVYVGIGLTRNTLHNRNIVSFGPTTLRATICYNLLRLGHPMQGDLVVDSMCGGGSIPIEGAVNIPGIYTLGGDNHEKAIARLKENIKHQVGKRGWIPMDGLCWDVTTLPLRNQSVDLFVVDLPFGKRMGNKFDNRRVYPAALTEMARVSRCGSGRAVLLTQDKVTLQKSLMNPPNSHLWRTCRKHLVNVGGLKAMAYVVQRTAKRLT